MSGFEPDPVFPTLSGAIRDLFVPDDGSAVNGVHVEPPFVFVLHGRGTAVTRYWLPESFRGRDFEPENARLEHDVDDE